MTVTQTFSAADITQTASGAATVENVGHVVSMPPEMTYLLIALAFILIMTLVIGTFKLIRYKIKVERCKCPIGDTVADHEDRLGAVEAWIARKAQ